jgi:toxin ParE1/3/4
MARVIRTPEAQADIDEIGDYIAADNPRAAERWLYSLGKEFERLARFPGIGRSRFELKPDLRSWPVGNYTIYYRPLQDGVLILHVLHGHRDVEPLF